MLEGCWRGVGEVFEGCLREINDRVENKLTGRCGFSKWSHKQHLEKY